MAGVQYGKLDPAGNSIRTLQLLPGRWIDVICCNLQTISLTTVPLLMLSHASGATQRHCSDERGWILLPCSQELDFRTPALAVKCRRQNFLGRRNMY